MLEPGDSYQTISTESRAIYREKASKFIAIALPVNDEEDVKQKLEGLRKSYHDANHHCYAYRIGNDPNRFRFNDDGEPSGSAGRPIYGQILSKDLWDVLVVVIRYFGGTKLGIPGLIHAYKTAAREALDEADVIGKTLTSSLMVHFDFPRMNDVMRILKEESVKIANQDFQERCSITFSVPRSRLEKVSARLSNLPNIYVLLDTKAKSSV
jgi:uncharacterized YigZ family protein